MSGAVAEFDIYFAEAHLYDAYRAFDAGHAALSEPPSSAEELLKVAEKIEGLDIDPDEADLLRTMEQIEAARSRSIHCATYFVFMFSIFEFSAGRICGNFLAKNGFRIKFGDLQGSGIERLRLFSSRLGPEDILEDAQWNKLKDLQIIRNFIVHSGGIPQSEEKRREVEKVFPRWKESLKFQDTSFDFDALVVGERFVRLALRSFFQFLRTINGRLEEKVRPPC